eukprot:5088708-Pleurochrysis_carterae.AAC.2
MAMTEREVNAASSAISCSFASAILRAPRHCSSPINSGVRVALAIAASVMVGCSLAGKSRLLGLDVPVEPVVAWFSSSKASTTRSGD